MTKAEKLDTSKFDVNHLAGDECWETVKEINRFGDVLISVTEKNEPSLLSNYLLDLAQSFNRFYLANRVIDDGKTCHARLAVTVAIQKILKKGLELLGISAPEKM